MLKCNWRWISFLSLQLLNYSLNFGVNFSCPSFIVRVAHSKMAWQRFRLLKLSNISPAVFSFLFSPLIAYFFNVEVSPLIWKLTWQRPKECAWLLHLFSPFHIFHLLSYNVRNLTLATYLIPLIFCQTNILWND